MRYRTNIIVSSDAHDPSTVGRFTEAVPMLEETWFDEELIINNSEEKFRRFIGYIPGEI